MSFIRDLLRARHYRKALEQIKADSGKVCRGFELCGPDDCMAAEYTYLNRDQHKMPVCYPWVANNSSVTARFIAEAALKGQRIDS